MPKPQAFNSISVSKPNQIIFMSRAGISHSLEQNNGKLYFQRSETEIRYWEITKSCSVLTGRQSELRRQAK